MKILISIFFLLFFTINADFVDTSLILKVEEKYGKFAKNRFIALNTMLEKSKNSDLRTKLEKINDFFNDIKYASDQTVYGTSDFSKLTK
jgi:predicted transglutaminase-like cysteine proteinase